MSDKRISVFVEGNSLFYRDLSKLPIECRELYDKSHSMPTYMQASLICKHLHYKDIFGLYISKDHKLESKKEYSFHIKKHELWTAF